MKLNVIVAHDKNRVIGNSSTNQIPWHLPPDLQHFRKLTTGFPIIMGKNTYLSLPKRPLPGRKNIVIYSIGNSNELNDIPYNDFENYDAPVIGFSDLTRAIIYCENWLKVEQAFIIGGARMYTDAIKNHHVRTVYRTLVDGEFDGDVKFPILKEGQWNLNPGDPLEYEGMTYYFDELTRQV